MLLAHPSTMHPAQLPLPYEQEHPSKSLPRPLPHALAHNAPLYPAPLPAPHPSRLHPPTTHPALPGCYRPDPHALTVLVDASPMAANTHTHTHTPHHSDSCRTLVPPEHMHTLSRPTPTHTRPAPSPPLAHPSDEGALTPCSAGSTHHYARAHTHLIAPRPALSAAASAGGSLPPLPAHLTRPGPPQQQQQPALAQPAPRLSVPLPARGAHPMPSSDAPGSCGYPVGYVTPTAHAQQQQTILLVPATHHAPAPRPQPASMPSAHPSRPPMHNPPATQPQCTTGPVYVHTHTQQGGAVTHRLVEHGLPTHRAVPPQQHGQQQQQPLLVQPHGPPPMAQHHTQQGGRRSSLECLSGGNAAAAQQRTASSSTSSVGFCGTGQTLGELVDRRGHHDTQLHELMKRTWNREGSGRELHHAIGRVLRSMVATSRQQGQVTKFDAVWVPNISVKDYFLRLHEYFQCSPCCHLLALIYIDRVVKRAPDFVVDALNSHRLLVTATMVAAKFYDDKFLSNAFYAQVGGVSLKEVNRLEQRFLSLLDYRLVVTPEELEQYYAYVLSLAQSMEAPAAH